jgi:hypothetical protein
LSQEVALEWLGEAVNKAETGQLEDEMAYLSSNMEKNQPKRRVQILGELSTISKSCTSFYLQRVHIFLPSLDHLSPQVAQRDAYLSKASP